MQTPICFNAFAPESVQDGVIRGVSVITEGEAKGHGVKIDHATLLSVKVCADSHPDGVKVKSEHGTDFGSIVGVLRNFRISGQKLLADLHLLKTHQDFARIVEMAETMPGEVGLSISFSGIEEEISGEKFARCLELYSVDLVDRPAANPNGLFQSVDSPPKNHMADANTLLSRIKSVFVETENADLAASQKQVTDLSEKIVTFESDLKAANESVAKLKADLAAKEAELAKVPDLIAKETAKVMASFGRAPIEGTPTPTPAEPAREDISKLKGREKVVAAFKAQSAAKANLIAK